MVFFYIKKRPSLGRESSKGKKITLYFLVWKLKKGFFLKKKRRIFSCTMITFPK